MSMARDLHAATRACAAAAAILLSPIAVAQDPLEATYLRYQRAIHAAELCRDGTFGTPEHTRMAGYIDIAINYGIATGRRLTLIEQAKGKVHDLVTGQGCADSEVGELLAIFDAEFAPLLAE